MDSPLLISRMITWMIKLSNQIPPSIFQTHRTFIWRQQHLNISWNKLRLYSCKKEYREQMMMNQWPSNLIRCSNKLSEKYSGRLIKSSYVAFSKVFPKKRSKWFSKWLVVSQKCKLLWMKHFSIVINNLISNCICKLSNNLPISRHSRS